MLSFLETFQIVFQLIFAGAFGACVGSLVNVLVYRLPLGLGVVTPPSRCPNCTTRLTWRENIPIFGWIMLRGRCRFCGVRISPEYPIVEAAVAALFMLLYAQCYLTPDPGWNASGWSVLRPEWASGGFAASWGPFVVVLVLMGSLTAMTIVDAKTFTIPLQLTWFPALVALIIHPLFAVYLGVAGRRLAHAPGWDWSLATPGRHGWEVIGASIGGVVGLGIANLLLAGGLIRRSFADYDEWERKTFPQREPVELDAATGPVLMDALPTSPDALVSDQASRAGETVADVWVQYPRARREMFKELVFLAPPATLAMVGGWIAHHFAGPWTPGSTPLSDVPAVGAPLWLSVLAGVLWGYLIGGGVVWLVRILGSLAFGKEAMGLGDVHLMAAVGACLGWVDATLAFFGAAFVGLAWWVFGLVLGGRVKQSMPYGPFLAVATLLVFVLKPWVEAGLSAVMPAWAPIDLP
ncbi:MAG: prepilin peptidase [Phycisphaeraceae bacterium]|nr:MAG: prepilin peptidase [Phycisphaeraceae bacterium]